MTETFTITVELLGRQVVLEDLIIDLLADKR